MDNRRLILLLVFSFSVIMLWDAWQKQSQPQQPVAAAPTATSQTAAGSATAAAVPTPSAIPGEAAPAAPAAVATATAAPASGIAKTIVKTDLLVAEISAQGGDLVRLELTRQ